MKLPLVRHYVKKLALILTLLFVVGCSPKTGTNVSVQVSTALPLTETSTPACMEVLGIDIEVVPISANGVTLKVTGLTPKEPVRIVLYSEFKGQGRRIECCPEETANENGDYEFTTGLKSENHDVEFKDWHVQIVHSKGVACTSFTLP